VTYHSHPPSGRKLALLAAVPLVAVAIGVPMAIGITTSHQRPNSKDPAKASASRPRHKRTEPVCQPDAGCALIPTSGAYLGAYLQPATYTPQGEVAAVRAFQHQTGRRLDLVHEYHPWNQPFPNPADAHFVDVSKVLLLTWGGTPDTRKIIAGDYDNLIRARAQAIRNLHHPILLEFRHEMDRPNLQWAVHGPADYIRAWDHIRAIFASVGATNVGWVWCPTGYGFQVGRAQAFYPGNGEVDWVCADVYSSSSGQSLAQAAAPFMRWAAHTGKPIIIGEFATNSPPSSWPAWLSEAGRFAEKHPQIKALAYFNGKGRNSQHVPFDYLLASDERAIRAFARLMELPYFRPALPPGA
jgi:hypothetical protein